MKRRRRSMLFCPAKDEAMMIKAKKYSPDCIIFDLEDAIAYDDKDNARATLCRVLEQEDFGDIEIFARINALNTEFGEKDVRALVKSGIKNIRLPMCESKENVVKLEGLLAENEKAKGIPIGTVKIQCSIETPRGVYNAYEIATASERVISISFGTEDYTNCLGVDRTKEVLQFLYARSQIAIAASMAGVDAIDTVFSDVTDIEGFEQEVRHIQSLGFSGKSCIHPKQVSKVNEIFTPSKEEIERARNIINAGKEAEERGVGVATFNGKMIDKPIIEKAVKVLQKAGEEV
ncbi:MAG: CoA ester lyase [Thermotaleaceae bacterium]